MNKVVVSCLIFLLIQSWFFRYNPVNDWWVIDRWTGNSITIDSLEKGESTMEKLFLQLFGIDELKTSLIVLESENRKLNAEIEELGKKYNQLSDWYNTVYNQNEECKKNVAKETNNLLVELYKSGEMKEIIDHMESLEKK